MPNKKMTWEEMKKKYPDEWLLIIEYDSDESGHLLSGIEPIFQNRLDPYW